MLKGLIVMSLVSLLLLIVAGCFKSNINEKEAQKILHDFYNDNVPEPINDRHLLSAGKPIVPYLIVEIQRKDMPKRRYAIGALGKIGDKQALPVLIKILEDNTELYYFRSDAIEAIWHIDKKLGEKYAAKYVGESKEFERTIQLLREGKI